MLREEEGGKKALVTEERRGESRERRHRLCPKRVTQNAMY